MKKLFFLPRFLALWLILSLSLPHSAFAMRQTAAAQSGAEEEVAQSLRAPLAVAPPLASITAGAEETLADYRQSLEETDILKLVAEAQKAIGDSKSESSLRGILPDPTVVDRAKESIRATQAFSLSSRILARKPLLEFLSAVWLAKHPPSAAGAEEGNIVRDYGDVGTWKAAFDTGRELLSSGVIRTVATVSLQEFRDGRHVALISDGLGMGISSGQYLETLARIAPDLHLGNSKFRLL